MARKKSKEAKEASEPDSDMRNISIYIITENSKNNYD